jgi:hypothetical protein
MSKHPHSTGALHNRDARNSPRQPLALDARIVVGDTAALTGRVRNISASGVFVHGAGAAPAIGTAVEVVLRWRGKNGEQALRLPASVVRVEPDGVALRFGRYDSVAYTALIDLVYNAGPVSQ